MGAQTRPGLTPACLDWPMTSVTNVRILRSGGAAAAGARGPEDPWIQAAARCNGHRSRRSRTFLRGHGRVNLDRSEPDVPGSDPDRSERDMSNLGRWHVAPADARLRPPSDARWTPAPPRWPGGAPL